MWGKNWGNDGRAKQQQQQQQKQVVLPAKQAASGRSSGAERTKELRRQYFTGMQPAAPLIFHMAMQI